MLKVAKTKADPTGQKLVWARAAVALRARLTKAQSEILNILRGMQKKRRTKAEIKNNATFYDYDTSPEALRFISDAVSSILNNELLESQDVMPIDWYWKDIIEKPYLAGTAESVVDMNRAITTAGINDLLPQGFPIAGFTVPGVVNSEFYQAGLSSVNITNFDTIKSLSQRTASQVITEINSGIAAGEPPTVIAKSIKERFNVSKSSANTIARTEVNQTFTNSKLRFTNEAAEITGLRMGVIHISALTSTTRKTHAARHGNAYTVEDQARWWGRSANRINCLCDVNSVVLDSRGKVEEKEFQDRIKAQRPSNNG